MKRRIFGILLCLALLPGMLALAEAQEGITLPEKVAAFFEGDSAWSGWTPVVADEFTLAGEPRWISAVVLEREGTRVLCLLKKNGPDGGYTWSDAATRVLRQHGDLPHIGIEPGVETEPEYSPVVTLTYNEENRAVSYGWNEVNGLWSIGGMQMQETYGDEVRHYVTASVFRMYLQYNEWIGTGDEAGGTIMQQMNNRKYGKMNRMLNNFDIEALPLSWIRAEEADIGDPERPAPGAQLNPLAEGEVEQMAAAVPVLLGPDSSFVQAAGDGVTPETEVQSIALYANYVLIAYREDDMSLWRYGYVPANAFAQKVRAPQSGFACTKAYVQEAARLTDCPEGGDELLTLAPGDEAIYLATLGSDWTLVQAEKDGVKAHGFVRSDALLIDYDMDFPMNEEHAGGTEAVVVADGVVVNDPFRSAYVKSVATVGRGDTVRYLDRLYDGYAYVAVETDDGPVFGFIEYWMIAPVDGVKLESNG